MIDLTNKHLPPRAILFDKSHQSYMQILGYREADDSYVTVPFIGGLPTAGRVATVALEVGPVNKAVENRRYTLVNAEFVEDRIKFRPLSIIIYDHMATLDVLHMAAMNQWFSGKPHDVFVQWVDRTEQVAVLVTGRGPAKWWGLKSPATETVAVPLKELLLTSWPVKVSEIWRQFES